MANGTNYTVDYYNKLISKMMSQASPDVPGSISELRKAIKLYAPMGESNAPIILSGDEAK